VAALPPRGQRRRGSKIRVENGADCGLDENVKTTTCSGQAPRGTQIL